MLPPSAALITILRTAKAMLRYCHVRLAQCFRLCFAKTVEVSHRNKLAKVRNYSKALSAFDCCFIIIVVTTVRFLKENV